MSILNFLLEIIDSGVTDNKTSGSNTPHEIGNTITLRLDVFIIIIFFLTLFFASTIYFGIKEDKRRKSEEQKQMREEMKKELENEIRKEFENKTQGIDIDKGD